MYNGGRNYLAKAMLRLGTVLFTCAIQIGVRWGRWQGVLLCLVPYQFRQGVQDSRSQDQFRRGVGDVFKCVEVLCVRVS